MSGKSMKNLPDSFSIGFFSPLAGVGTSCGYGYAAVELIKSWQRLGIPVWTNDVDAPVIFNFGQPHFYERVEGKLNIGYTPWESTGVPASWVTKMNQMDEIWTTCNANAKWYLGAGVEVPIFVLHHGLNDDHYPRIRRSRGLGPLKFLHIGEPAPRKGGELAYTAFKKAFGELTDVHLTIKGRPRFDVHGSNVTVIDDWYTQDQMTELMLNQHIMVYPTNGEGFGLIPFQAAATGMPTIVTDWSAPKDYMQYCYPLNTDALVEPDYEPHIGLWAKPSEDHLVDLMRDLATEDSDQLFHKAFRNATQMRLDGWSWDNLAKKSVKQMIKSLK